MKYYFPIHLDGGNRGCEGIAKGTAQLLRCEQSQMVGLCTNVLLDEKLGIDDYVSLYPIKKMSFIDKIARHIYGFVVRDINKRKRFNYFLRYHDFLKEITRNDLMLSTGGDMMCYDNNQVIYTNEFLHHRGIKTVLWGCSMGKENLTEEKKETLHNFSLIYTRESLTYNFLKSLDVKNVVCYPDPAFVLQPEKVDLPPEFNKNNVVGINLSNFVLGGYSLNSEFGIQVKILIDFILKETNFNILLIPHVTWADQDDRITANKVSEEINNNRLNILNIDNLNYCQIRYVISQCRFFIGGRTHAIISAYSSCIPSIAIGYSIKSRGIAKDLGLPDNLVVDSKKEIKRNELLDSFLYLIENEQSIKFHLHKVIPDYVKKTYMIRADISKLK